MSEKWKSAVDKEKSFGALFDFISHDLLLAKLHAYGFSLSTLKSIPSYLKDRKEKTKIDSTYGSWEGILFQGIIGPWLFNIFLCDLFFSINEKDFASCLDYNTPYVTGDRIKNVIN